MGYGYIQNTALKDSTYLVPVEAEACARDNVMKGRGGGFYIECQMFSLASFDLNKLEMQEREKILEPL